jgi:hypothetical protein
MAFVVFIEGGVPTALQITVVVLVEVGGMQIEIIERGAPEPAPAAPAHTLPRYLPLTADDWSRPGYLSPAAATLWRFGRLFCAKNQEGYPLITWHPCGRRIVGSSGPLDPASLLATLGQGPQWLSAEHALWQRLALPTGPTTCWLVGGQLPRDEFTKTAFSLPRIEDGDWRLEIIRSPPLPLSPSSCHLVIVSSCQRSEWTSRSSSPRSTRSC